MGEKQGKGKDPQLEVDFRSDGCRARFFTALRRFRHDLYVFRDECRFETDFYPANLERFEWLLQFVYVEFHASTRDIRTEVSSGSKDEDWGDFCELVKEVTAIAADYFRQMTGALRCLLDTPTIEAIDHKFALRLFHAAIKRSASSGNKRPSTDVVKSALENAASLADKVRKDLEVFEKALKEKITRATDNRSSGNG